MKTSENELNDLVIKVLSHQERRRILMIVGSYPEGVKYTGILGETGLSTGRLNYHMRNLRASLTGTRTGFTASASWGGRPSPLSTLSARA
jgi:hypothetical protein